MVFNIKNKVALVTGGATGIGFRFVKELLRNEAKVSLICPNCSITQVDVTHVECILIVISRRFWAAEFESNQKNVGFLRIFTKS